MLQGPISFWNFLKLSWTLVAAGVLAASSSRTS